MDPLFKKLLQQHQHDIINDLDVRYVIDELFSKEVLSQEDFEDITNLKSRTDQVRCLIDKLIKYGNNNSYIAFVDSLAEDYKWLYQKLTVENNETMLNESFEDSLSLGDVPRLPAHHVKRVAVEREITSKLKQLARHKILALHGMSGCGKTCSAISVLRDNPELITDFGGVVMWLNFGTCKTEDDIIAQQNKLLRKIKSTYVHTSIMTASISLSSISSNVDNISLSSYDWTWEMLRDELKKHFSEPALKESLLVLDEVNEEKIVVAFDIGCKLMITTRDVDVVSKYHPQIVNVQKSFEEREALELFASCLEESVSNLPAQARKLVEICKGMPFNIALIGAQLAENKERLKDDPSYWKNYLNKLEKKDYFSLFKGKDNTMKKTIEVCINSLQANILPLYKRLAVLPDNVKVFAQVLSRLWNKDVAEVESIMKSLTRKSLIIETYDRERKNYIYEVHDLIMNYLRTNTKEEDLKKLHSDLLTSYSYDNVDNVSCDIPDDGYIAFYIGYHIQKTDNLNNKWGLFNKLFLDLKFLGNKVRLTGPDDVKMDLQKYENYIVKDEMDRSLAHSLRTFLSTHGTDLYHYPSTDILQSILQHEAAGLLYNKAASAAQAAADNHELYFDFLHEHDVDEVKHSTIDVREVITAVCFLGNYVVVGTSNGLIKFFHSTTHKLQKELTGMTSAVTWVGVSCLKHPPVVAALSLEGIIKLWYVDDFDDDDDGVIEEEPEEAYNNNHPGHVTIKQTFGAYVHCRWSDNEDFLVAHNTKMIFLYKPNGDLISTINNFDRDRELLCCVTCNNDKFVAVATTNGKSRMVEIIDLKTKERVMTFEETDSVLDMVTVPGTNKIITLKHNEIMEHEFKVTSISSNKCRQCKCGSVIKSDSLNDNLSFKAIAVNKTGTLLFVSTDDSRVVCVNLKTHSRVFDLENRRGNVIAMAVSEVMMWDEFEPGSDVLLTGTDITENSAKVWYLEASYISQIAKRNGKVRLTSKFDVSFLNASSPNTPKTATPGSMVDSVSNTPRRHQSFANHREITKTPVKNTLSLDRHSLKPLNLKGICNNNDKAIQPLLAVVDDKNNIQVMRGRKVLTEILEKSDEHITCVKISPCNHYIIYGLQSGSVKKYTLRTKEMVTIMDVYSPVQYLNYVNPNLLMAAGKNRSLMAYRLTEAGDWTLEMLQRGNTHLGSQELLDDLQGLKLKNGQVDSQSTSSSDTGSVDSRERMFRSGDIKSMCKGSGLVECFWVPNTGLVTVEHNATTKLWTADMKVANILHARQTDVHIRCAALQNNVLVLCDSDNKRFQTFELINGIELKIIQEYKLNNVISSCALTADGNILAIGLDSGNVVVWNVKGKRLITILKHHKSKVQSCCFSPVPDRLYRSPSMQPHSPNQSPVSDQGDDQPPLVLVTMATEIVWWNITYFVRVRANQKTVWRTGVNAMTPIGTPLENRNELQPTAHNSNKSTSTFFFGDGLYDKHCWREIWNGKTCKKGSKRQDILACIKLTGVNARKLCHDDWFTCFVTVDNPGHVHIMNVIKSQCS
ncbi:hypothetical protein O3G_MSEX004970 [Manduca sexta]|uniref:CARD domain-containing protein n=1 Tax=Manduca sexta TaxID=7130 RepID=A0A921YY39_MANSE|nr:hypothetical protein O3G_MSEX004970 [Manduca sexta]